MTEWFQTTIGEQAQLQRGYDITRPEQRVGKVPVVSSGGISSYHDQAMVRGPGVILGRKGVVGSVFYIKEDFWPHDTTLWVKNFSENNPRFVYYFFLSIAAKLSSLDVGSANPTLNRNHVHPERINWPDRKYQDVTANLLGSLDDKIELNRRMADTLEAVARALFKSWFVDFDPVRAKAEGRHTGLADEISALFPSALSDIGLPQGWSYQPLSKIGRFLNGLALQKYPAENGDPSLPVIKITELRSGPTAKSDRARLDVPMEYLVKDGDHLFSWSGSLIHCRWTYGPGALNQHLFKVTSVDVPDWLLYEAVEQHLAVFRHIAAGKAVTMGHIQRHHLDEALVAVPPKTLLKAMDLVMSALHERSFFLALQSRTLAILRDTLLPKLISGELRIADAEKRIAAA